MANWKQFYDLNSSLTSPNTIVKIRHYYRLLSDNLKTAIRLCYPLMDQYYPGLSDEESDKIYGSNEFKKYNEHLHKIIKVSEDCEKDIDNKYLLDESWEILKKEYLRQIEAIGFCPDEYQQFYNELGIRFKINLCDIIKERFPDDREDVLEWRIKTDCYTIIHASTLINKLWYYDIILSDNRKYCYRYEEYIKKILI
jgi:hypothetical protein